MERRFFGSSRSCSTKPQSTSRPAAASRALSPIDRLRRVEIAPHRSVTPAGLTCRALLAANDDFTQMVARQEELNRAKAREELFDGPVIKHLRRLPTLLILQQERLAVGDTVGKHRDRVFLDVRVKAGQQNALGAHNLMQAAHHYVHYGLRQIL